MIAKQSSAGGRRTANRAEIRSICTSRCSQVTWTLIPQKPLNEYVPRLTEYDRIRSECGFEPVRPKVVAWVYCTEAPAGQNSEAERFVQEYGDSAVRHYEFEGDHFAGLPGYEHHADNSTRLNSENVDFGAEFMNEHVYGNPEPCLAKLERIDELLGPSEIVCVFKSGSMTMAQAERSLHLFAREALPEARNLPVREPASA